MLQLYKCWAELPDPSPASNDLSGEIPARALRFCEPFLVANSAGMLINAPADLDLFWTGSDVLAQFVGMDELILVDRLFLPDYADHWRDIAPADATNVMPPFLEAFPERGVVQIWSGLFMVTGDGTSAWVRGPVNRGVSLGYSIVEGVIDTDWWTGPLFSVIQFHKTDFPVRLKRSQPLLQVIPVDAALLKLTARDVEAIVVQDAPPHFWNNLVATTMRRNTQPAGSYRRQAAAH